MESATSPRNVRTWLIVGAAAVGAAIGGAGIANAATSTSSPSSASTIATDSTTADNTQTSGPGRPAETPLTGDTADKVTAAAQAAVPDGTVDRVETDSEGTYEAHVTKADGTRVIVQVGSDFTVTDIVEGGRGGPGGRDCPNGPDGAGSGSGTAGGETPSPSETSPTTTNT